MERLSDTAIEIINELHTERLDYSSEYIPLIDAANRLAAYEDSGLEPEEIKGFAEDVAYQFGYYFPIKDILYISTGGLSTLEWAFRILGWNDPHPVPECEGRLVVLPCGTDVNLVRDGHTYKADHWNHTLTAFRDAPENKSGMQVALFSIKEAEEALKGGDG